MRDIVLKTITFAFFTNSTPSTNREIGNVGQKYNKSLHTTRKVKSWNSLYNSTKFLALKTLILAIKNNGNSTIHYNYNMFTCVVSKLVSAIPIPLLDLRDFELSLGSV